MDHYRIEPVLQGLQQAVGTSLHLQGDLCDQVVTAHFVVVRGGKFR